MTETGNGQSPFIDYLVGLTDPIDRAALAALRRGLGRPPGTAPELYPYVARFFAADTERRDTRREDAMFTVAALFGLHPHHRPRTGSVVNVLRRALKNDDGAPVPADDGVGRRVLSLLDADEQTLPTHLRHLITLIHSRDPERPIDFDLLLNNIIHWDHEDRWVQRRWARDWWAWSAPLESGESAED